jgi:hypothetical protein
MELKCNRRKMLSLFAFAAGAISILFGAIHTVAVLQMECDYDRDLVFLLFSGGVLIFCGLLNIMTRNGVENNIRLANSVSIMSTLFLVLFCLSLTPFFRAKLNYLLIGIHIAYLIYFGVVVLTMGKEQMNS